MNKVLLAASAAGFAYFAWGYLDSGRVLRAVEGTGQVLHAIGATVDLGVSRQGMAACVVVFLLSWFLGRPRRPAA